MKPTLQPSHSIEKTQPSVQNNTSKTAASHPAVAPIQFAGFVSHNAPAEQTAVTVIKNHTGLNVGDIKLPFNSGIGSATERASEITADIDNTSVSSAQREDDRNMLSKITGMARDEAFLLLGVDPQKFYDAGHLIGDQLLKNLGADYSFKLKNLAPQSSAFNSPAYANIMEEPIKAAAEAGKSINMNVKLDYPSAYSIPFSTILNRGIIGEDKFTVDETAGTANLKGTVVNLNDQLQFPRRIPKKWTLTAKVTSGSDRLSSFTKEKGDKAVKRLVKEDELNDKKDKLSFKIPYKYSVEGRDLLDAKIVTDLTPATIKFEKVRTRILNARQWKPPIESKINKEELAGALNFFFPTVEDDSLNEFFGIVKKEDFQTLRHITRGMTLTIAEIANTDIAFDDINHFTQRILVEMDKAQDCYLKSNHPQFKIHLHNAHAALQDFREITATVVNASEVVKQRISSRLEISKKASQEIREVTTLLQHKLSPSFALSCFGKSMSLNTCLLNVAFALLNNNLPGALENLGNAQILIDEIYLELQAERQRIELSEAHQQPEAQVMPQFPGFAQFPLLTYTPHNAVATLPQTSLTVVQDTPEWGGQPSQSPPTKKRRLNGTEDDDQPK